ncbi:TPA: hypothetical protein QDB26_003989 [Burkholderia vietnamiensis]|nr:hypothetical protein [Burkholderia vietnamiensis]HDR9215224.1 hypothetical protein [Burkholderia vietnamiensis]
MSMLPDENMQPTRESTGAEALESVMEKVAPQVLAHWEVGYKIHKEEANQMREWTMEVVKHLAIINAAGLAGVATLIAMQINETISRSYFVFSAISFALGLALAVVDMHLNSMGHLARVKEMRRRIDELRNSYKNSSLHLLKSLRENMIEAPFNDGGWFTVAGICGWISAIAFLSGIVGIFCALKPLIH